jgi:NADH:ubiquinone oxidoreductase subunit 4 (subunit M)
VLVPLVVLVFWLGVYPQPFLSRIEPSLRATAQLTAERAALCRLADAQAILGPPGGSR